MKKKQKVEKENNERWLLTYADLITLLMVFFVVMFSISKADSRKFANFSSAMQKALNMGILDGSAVANVTGEQTGGDSLMEDFAAIKASMQKLSEDMGQMSGVDVRLGREGIVVDLSGGLLFDSGKAELKPKALPYLDRIAKDFRSKSNELRVGGHTDNIPPGSAIYPTNWELSTARALAVGRYLVEDLGIQPDRVAATGYAEFRPVADNGTREHRALNRRVEIIIVYPNTPFLMPTE